MYWCLASTPEVSSLVFLSQQGKKESNRIKRTKYKRPQIKSKRQTACKLNHNIISGGSRFESVITKNFSCNSQRRQYQEMKSFPYHLTSSPSNNILIKRSPDDAGARYFPRFIIIYHSIRSTAVDNEPLYFLFLRHFVNGVSRF